MNLQPSLCPLFRISNSPQIPIHDCRGGYENGERSVALFLKFLFSNRDLGKCKFGAPKTRHTRPNNSGMWRIRYRVVSKHSWYVFGIILKIFCWPPQSCTMAQSISGSHSQNLAGKYFTLPLYFLESRQNMRHRHSTKTPTYCPDSSDLGPTWSRTTAAAVWRAPLLKTAAVLLWIILPISTNASNSTFDGVVHLSACPSVCPRDMSKD